MILLLPLLLTTLSTRIIAGLLTRRGVSRAFNWSSWSGAAATGMAVVFTCTGITHFIEPQRSGLVAIVPTWLPEPGLIITLTGIAEIALAIALLIPRTRRLAAIASVALLLALLPANIVAANGVDHPAAPNTPLIPRIALQAVFIAFSASPLFARRRTMADHPEEQSAIVT